jgi:hypothetical protein
MAAMSAWRRTIAFGETHWVVVVEAALWFAEPQAARQRVAQETRISARLTTPS